MYIISKIDIFRVIVPPLMAVFLFIFALFGLVLPVSKANLLEQKKSSITDLTQAAWTILDFTNDRLIFRIKKRPRTLPLPGPFQGAMNLR